MWPWESEPKSIATGILDDETYDWLAVVGACSAAAASPWSCPRRAWPRRMSWATRPGSSADATGSSGLAGLLDLRAEGVVGPEDRVAVLFTGTERR